MRQLLLNILVTLACSAAVLAAPTAWAQDAPPAAPPAAAPVAAPAPAPAPAPALDVPMFALADLKPGLKGISYTVIRGTNIQQFNVEVLELIPQGGFDGGPLILARFSGDVVDFSNGIAAGYSGSPVYIGDKLLGAVSMAIPMTDTHIGGITPIQSMLTALPDVEEPDFSGTTVLPTTTNNGMPLDKDGERITYMNDPAAALRYNDAMRATGQQRYAAVLATTPIYASGLSPAVRDVYATEFSRLLGSNFQLMDRPMGHAVDYGLLGNQDDKSRQVDKPGLLLLQKNAQPPLKPGDAVAVSLMQGDIEMNAIGTLTYSDAKGRFLCFGHPMFQSGKTNVPVGKAYVVWTFKALDRAFKEGVRLDTVGTLTKDQGAACGGSFDVQPDMIPVRVKIKDTDLGIEQTKRFSVIRHPDYTPMLVAMGMSQAAMEVLDREPRGTMKMSYYIEGVGLTEPLRRTNYYCDDTNVINGGASEIAPISNLLETNIYRDVKVTKVEIMIEITRNRTNASIDDAKIIWDKDGAESAPGTPDGTATPPPGEAAPEAKPEEQKPAGEEAPTQPSASGWPLTSQARPFTWPLQDGPPAPPDGAAPGATPMPGMQPPMDMAQMANVPTFKPGDTIPVKVRLQPYRTDSVWREFKIQVPEDFPSGSTMVVVHGGGDLISPSELNGKGRMLFGMGPIIDVTEHDLDSVLQQIVEWPLNNELLLTLVRPYDPAQAQQLGDEEDGKKVEDKVDSKYQMEWVMYNGFMLPVNIVGSDQKLTPAEQAAGKEVAGEKPGAAAPESEGNGDSGKEDPGDDGDTKLPF